MEFVNFKAVEDQLPKRCMGLNLMMKAWIEGLKDPLLNGWPNAPYKHPFGLSADNFYCGDTHAKLRKETTYIPREQFYTPIESMEYILKEAGIGGDRQ